MNARQATAAALLAAVGLAAFTACGDDDAAAPTTATPTTAARTTAATTTTTTTTEKTTTTTEYRSTKLRCIDGREQGSYEFREVCVDGEWVDRPTERPTTTAPSTPQTAALSETAQWFATNPALKDTACSVGMSITQSVNPGVHFDRAEFDAICSGSSPTPPPDPILAEVDAAIAPAINAWLADPSGPTYDAIVAAVTPYIGRWGDADLLVPYPGSDNDVIRALDNLKLPSVQVPPIIYNGTYTVGEDIQPGTYRAQDVENCYWATLDEAGEINDNNFVNSAPQVLATIKPSDYAFENDCGFMVKVR